MAKDQKVYMPLMMGDWIKGTRGMRAEVKGVYIGLLIHQYDHGYLPSDMYELELIEPEVNKVWVKIKDKFIEVEPGKLQNRKLEEVREFWTKQKKNGKKGGRPKKQNPNNNPNVNPKPNPNNNHHNDLDIDIDNEFKYNLKEAEEKVVAAEILVDIMSAPTWTAGYLTETVYDELTRENLLMTYRDVDVDDQWIKFMAKVRGSPQKYANHDTEGLRLAFNYHLQKAPKKYGTGKAGREQTVNARREGFAKRHSSGSGD